MTTKKPNHNLFHYIFTLCYYFLKGLIAGFIWLLLGLAGYFIFQSGKSPYDLLIGLPLLAVSVGFIVNSVFSELLSVFSPQFNKAVCLLCNDYKEK